jgi:hypothetical protein
MSGLQEKFQVILPPAPDEDDGTEWKTFESQRQTGEAGQVHVNNQFSDEEVDGKFNLLPPGMDINDQARFNPNNMPLSMAGSSDASADTNLGAFDKGYTRRQMNGADDQYTGEHADHFYGTAYGYDEDGKLVEGAVERNNYLDRI